MEKSKDKKDILRIQSYGATIEIYYLTLLSVCIFIGSQRDSSNGMAHKEKGGKKYEILYVNLLGKKKHIGCRGCCLIIDNFSPFFFFFFFFYWISNKKKRRLFLFRCVIYGPLPPLHSALYRDVCLFHSRTTESPQWNEKNKKKEEDWNEKESGARQNR